MRAGRGGRAGNGNVDGGYGAYMQLNFDNPEDLWVNFVVGMRGYSGAGGRGGGGGGASWIFTDQVTGGTSAMGTNQLIAIAGGGGGADDNNPPGEPAGNYPPTNNSNVGNGQVGYGQGTSAASWLERQTGTGEEVGFKFRGSYQSSSYSDDGAGGFGGAAAGGDDGGPGSGFTAGQGSWPGYAGRSYYAGGPGGPTGFTSIHGPAVSGFSFQGNNPSRDGSIQIQRLGDL